MLATAVMAQLNNESTKQAEAEKKPGVGDNVKTV